jgi:glycosyltransferase involved in cell wall biosynthesis
MQQAGGGVHTYCAELLAAHQRRGSAGLIVRARADVAGLLPDRASMDCRSEVSGLRRYAAALSRVSSHVDLVHGLDAELPLGRMANAAATVVTVHDLTMFDGSGARGARARLKRLTNGRSIVRADSVIANSGAVAQQIQDRFDREATVVMLAPRTDVGRATADVQAAVRVRYGLPDRFVLHVGASDVRKRLDLAAVACKSAGLPLITVGPRSFSAKDQPAGSTLGGRHLGFVHNDTLAALYSSAALVLYLSDHEGFGLPPIEAMACGAVVVANPTGALPELAAKHPNALALVGGERLDPSGVDPIADRMSQLINDADERASMVQAGQLAVNELTWDRTLSGTLDVYRGLGIDVAVG